MESHDLSKPANTDTGSPCGEALSRYQFLADTYATEIEKVLSVWSMFDDNDLRARPHPSDTRGRSLLEHMVHQSLSENLWFATMLGVIVTDNPLPSVESRLNFMALYRHNATLRLRIIATKPDTWWEQEVPFFELRRSRAWILVRRVAHTAHHRGQQTALLRVLNHRLHSTYGPTADTGGLMQHHAPVIYPYRDLDTLLQEEHGNRNKAPLPGPGVHAPTERP